MLITFMIVDIFFAVLNYKLAKKTNEFSINAFAAGFCAMGAIGILLKLLFN